MDKGTLGKLMKLSKYDLKHGATYATLGFVASALITMPFLIANSVELGEARDMTKVCATQAHDYEQATHHTALGAAAYAAYDDATMNTEIDIATSYVNKAQALDCRP